jgi:hypothetical protein
MAWFKKTSDPISDRAKALNGKIALLESQIKALDSQLQTQKEQPRLRSTAIPQGETVTHTGTSAAPEPVVRVLPEPVFEEVDQDKLIARSETPTTPEHFNELGMRKYDLPALLRRVRGQFQGPSTTNPKLVSYLAAGGIQGLRPLRYEKRVARNRFIALVIILFFVLLGVIAMFVHR